MIVIKTCTTEACGGVTGYCAAVVAAFIHHQQLVVHILIEGNQI